MSDREYKFSDGEIIFAEGERSQAPFVLISGQVELLKNTVNGLARLALISPGEVFGETGIIDSSSRSATARAIGQVVAEEIDQDGLIDSGKNEPEMALKVIGNLNDRLPQTNEAVISPTSQKVLDEAQDRSSVWTLIGGLIAKRRTKKRLLEFRVAPFAADPEGTYSVQISHILNLEPEIHATLLREPLPAQGSASYSTHLNTTRSFGREILFRDGADLLIHGEVNETRTAIHMRFIAQHSELDQIGNCLITDRLSLSVNLKPEHMKLMVAAAVAATVPRSESYRLMMRPVLVNALEASKDSGTDPPLELTLADQATVHMTYGNIVATVGNHVGDLKCYKEALSSYQKAAESLNQETAPLEWANAHYHLARTRHAIAEKGGGLPMLAKALESCQASLGYYTNSDYPMEWGLLQGRLGSLLYKTDTVNGNNENLKTAVAAFQSALQIINKDESPLKWSEVKNSLAQVLQVWGDVAGSEELLERAIRCCHDALKVRNREETPLLWAATQNNMGSALFLLGRLTSDSNPVERALESFGKAMKIYEAYGAVRLSKVSKRNYSRAEDLLRSKRERRVPKLSWEDEALEEQEKQRDQKSPRETDYVAAAE